MYKRYEQTQSPLWFLRNSNSFVYFIRELSGVFIAFYCVYFAWKWLNDNQLGFTGTKVFFWISMVTFGASIIHTLTWLWVTTQVTPQPLPRWAQYALFMVLLSIFTAVSAGAYFLLYI